MKSLMINELLTWAFVQELPKGGGVEGMVNMHSAWGVIMKWAELMTKTSHSPYNHENFMIEQGAPHDDALVVGEAVADLAHCQIVIPDGWSPLCDWPRSDARMAALIDDAVARATERFTRRAPAYRSEHLVSLVVGSAVLAREPQWESPVSAIRMVERAGRPAWFLRRTVKDVFGRENEFEVDGYNAKSGRPHRGAYRKFEFSDDPVGDILGRLDRELWAAALKMLEGKIANRLIDHRLTIWDGELSPWGKMERHIVLLENKGKPIKIFG